MELLSRFSHIWLHWNFDIFDIGMFVLRSSISVQVSTAIFGINKDEEEKGGGVK